MNAQDIRFMKYGLSQSVIEKINFDDIRNSDFVAHIRRVGVTFYEKGEERVPELTGS